MTDPELLAEATTRRRPPNYGPARAGSGIKEIDELWDANDELRRNFNTAVRTMTQVFNMRLADAHDRIDRLEALLNPLTVDPQDPDIEWNYRRGDGILVPAPSDPEARLKMIADGVKLIPRVHRPARGDGRIDVVAPPEMAS